MRNEERTTNKVHAHLRARSITARYQSNLFQAGCNLQGSREPERDLQRPRLVQRNVPEQGRGTMTKHYLFKCSLNASLLTLEIRRNKIWIARRER